MKKVAKNDTFDGNEKAREARNAYYRAWRKNNPEKVKESTMRYWLKKAKEQEKEEHNAV